MAPTLPEQARKDLAATLESLKPRSLLIAGDETETLAETLQSAGLQAAVERRGLEALQQSIDELPIYDAVVLHGVVERLDKPAAETLLGRLRDLHGRHVFVFVSVGDARPGQHSHWRQTDLLALGFSLYKHYDDEAGDLHLYRFELETYKATPEWLNSKYWANPELFGKYRW